MSDREGGPEFLVVFSPLFFFRLSLELVESRSFSFFHPFISVVVRRNFFNIFFFFQSASKSVLSPLVSDRHRYRQQIKTALVIFSSVALGFLVIFPIQVIMHVHDYDYDYDPNDFSPAALAFFFFYSFFIPFMLFHPTAVEIFFFYFFLLHLHVQLVLLLPCCSFASTIHTHLRARAVSGMYFMLS